MYNDAYSSNGNAGVQAGLNSYIVKIFGTMFLGLVVTALAALLVATNEALMSVFYGTPLVYILLIAELAIVFLLSARIQKLSYTATLLMFYLYSIINGITLASIFFVYDLGTIYTAFFTAAISFGIMAIYGAVTKKDLTKIGSILIMLLVGVLIATLINTILSFFISTGSLELIISFVAVAVFVGLVAYDTQKLKSYYYSSMSDYQMQRKIGIMGALSLYLDFINIFLYLLRIFASKKD